MAAITVIPHSPTGEQSNSNELHTLLEQLDESELAALVTLIYAILPEGARAPLDGERVAFFVRIANWLDYPAAIEALAEFALLYAARNSMGRKTKRPISRETGRIA